MCPNIHALIMDHKEAFQNFRRSIEVDSVPISDIVVINHKLGGRFRVSDIMKLVFFRCI